jgi:hypothetical protein
MDNQNSPTTADPNQTSDPDKSQSMTDACSTMKDEIKTEAQRMVSAPETMGKPQKLTDAVSVMKDEIKTEAEQILSPQQPDLKPKKFTDACEEIKDESKQEAQRIVAGSAATTNSDRS